jgi:glycine/serine hydroxymethyltransferase
MAAENPMFPWGLMPLEECDPEVSDLVEKEKNRQWRGLELIASEVRCALVTAALVTAAWCGSS